MNSRRNAFTLVELLVVIGIIAVLVAILLPVLGNARRAADAVKCAAGLREIGNAFQLYALDSRGWYPPPQLQPASGKVYNVDGIDYPTNGYNVYWFNFLAKYVTKGTVGSASTTVLQATEARKTIFWACPTWLGYTNGTTPDGVNVVQIGYGMSQWPTFSQNNPRGAGTFPSTAERAFIQDWGASTQVGTWIRQKTWQINGSQRVLVADSRFWLAESQPSGSLANFPPPQSALQNTITYTANNQTTIDVFRHGKFPPKHPTIPNTHDRLGGKVSYNLLWADGHVTTEGSQETAYRGIRQRFPG